MAEQDVKNAEKTLAYFLSARRRAAASLAGNFDNGQHSSTDHEFARSFAMLQSGVDAARKALDEENCDPEYLAGINQDLIGN